MKLKLTNEQFEWLLVGSSLMEANVEILRQHYVHGRELKDLSKEAGFSSPSRIYTLVQKFERQVERRLEETQTEMSIIVHDAGDHRFWKFDKSQ